MSDSIDKRTCRGSGWPTPAGPKFPQLSDGDLVAVVAPAFAVPPAALDDGLERLTRMGYAVRLGRHVRARHGYLAGTDDDRVDDLVRAWTDPDVRAIWFARGGYGSARLLDRIPWRRLRGQSKLLVGFSDLTALFAPALERTGSRAVYGPVVAELGRRESWDRASLLGALDGRFTPLRFRAGQVLVPGRARGRLLGGNLSVLAHLAGTRWFPDLDGAVLALEDVGEETYRVDRLLTQLRLSGALSRVAAIVLGRFDPPARRRFPPERPFPDVVGEILAPLGVPVVRDLPFGHVPRKRSLLLGAGVEVDTAARVVRPVARAG